MKRSLGRFIFLALLQCAAGGASAQAVAYSFSTGANPFGTPGIASLFASTASVSGTFTYDASSPFVTDTGTGLLYGGFSPTSSAAASFASLSGSVAGLSFSDSRGTALVSNDRTIPGFAGPVDGFQLLADPSLTSTSVRNFSGFAIEGYTLVNARLFWFETQSTPELIPDFLGGEALSAAPPSIHGRLALDFIATGTSPTAPAGFVFFDNVTVGAVAPIPEPSTYAMLLAGLGLLALTARRRKLAEARRV